MLSNYQSPFDATVVSRLKKKGAILVGSSNMDEFGMGSFNLHSFYGRTLNPHSKDHVVGGSSGGSAASIAGGFCLGALGSDTGGSVRLPAAYCGIVGFKPSYGRLSRHGLVGYASSLDTVGVMGRSVDYVSDIFDAIEGPDLENDSTSIYYDKQDPDKRDGDLNDLTGVTVGIPEEFYVEGLSGEMLNIWDAGIERLESLNARIVSVSLPSVKDALACYYVIATAEASSNLARYDGIRYGVRSEEADQVGEEPLYAATRTMGFGEEVKKRLMLGTFVLEADSYTSYFGKAQKLRRLIVQDFQRVFSRVDLLLTPSSMSPAPKASEVGDDSNVLMEYVNDVMTVPSSLAGLPSISVPFKSTDKVGSDGVGQVKPGKLPLGLQLVGPRGKDRLVLNIAKKLK